jgi:hypothetical protein
MVRELSQFLNADAGQSQDLGGSPGPEGTSFLALEIATLAGSRILGPQVARCLRRARGPAQDLAPGGELLARDGAGRRGEQLRGTGAAVLGGGDQGG